MNQFLPKNSIFVKISVFYDQTFGLKVIFVYFYSQILVLRSKFLSL